MLYYIGAAMFGRGASSPAAAQYRPAPKIKK